jgi:hypothetical protein
MRCSDTKTATPVIPEPTGCVWRIRPVCRVFYPTHKPGMRKPVAAYAVIFPTSHARRHMHFELPLSRPSKPNALQISPPTDILLETYTGQVLGTMVKYAIQCHSFDGSTNLMSKSRMIWAPWLVWDIPNLPRITRGSGETMAIAFWLPLFVVCLPLSRLWTAPYGLHADQDSPSTRRRT